MSLAKSQTHFCFHCTKDDKSIITISIIIYTYLRESLAGYFFHWLYSVFLVYVRHLRLIKKDKTTERVKFKKKLKPPKHIV